MEAAASIDPMLTNSGASFWLKPLVERLLFLLEATP
jgi:hypothetical protein